MRPHAGELRAELDHSSLRSALFENAWLFAFAPFGSRLPLDGEDPVVADVDAATAVGAIAGQDQARFETGAT